MGCSQAKQTEPRNESPFSTVLQVEIRKGSTFKVEFGNPIIIYVNTKQSITLSEAGIAYVTSAPPPFPAGWHGANQDKSGGRSEQFSMDVMFQPSAVRSAIESVILFTYVDYNTIGIPYPIEGCLYVVCSTPLNYAIYSTGHNFGIRQLQTTTLSRTPVSPQQPIARFNPIGRSAPIDIPSRGAPKLPDQVPFEQNPPIMDPTHTPDSKHIQPKPSHTNPIHTTPSAPPLNLPLNLAIYQQSAPELHYRPVCAADQDINHYLDAQLGEQEYQPGYT